jgi:hypothetical protein
MMVIPAAKPLFAWDELEDSPSLHTIKQLLDALPDAKLLDSLRNARGKGRNDYPVHVLWGVVVLRVVLRHLTTEAVLGELRRNAGLRALIGIDSEADVPKPWNLSRFEGHARPGAASHALERDLLCSSNASASRSPRTGSMPPATPTRLSAAEVGRGAGEEQGGLAPDSGGRKEYTDDEGKVTGSRMVRVQAPLDRRYQE